MCPIASLIRSMSTPLVLSTDTNVSLHSRGEKLLPSCLLTHLGHRARAGCLATAQREMTAGSARGACRSQWPRSRGQPGCTPTVCSASIR